MIAPARVAAYQILSAVSSGRVDLPAAIARARAGLPDERDRALAADIATGVQRWRLTLDYLIARVAKRPVDRLDAEILEVLRLSAYQLLHLTRVPASAVVDDAVNLARKVGKKSAAGFVNATLRALSRQRRTLPLPERPVDPSDRDAAIAYLSTTHSHPPWLAERWFDRFGLTAAEAWVTFNNRPAPLTLRANTLRGSADACRDQLRSADVAVRPGRFAPLALIVEAGHPLRHPGAESGWFVVQDEASQLVALLAGAQPGPRVLDTCASPGGKASAIAAEMAGHGLLVACDIRSRRIALLRRTIEATRATRVHLVQADVGRPLPFAATFDTVIVDAPCSGLGTLRRDPDIRWKRLETDLAVFARGQLEKLGHSAALVRPGGRLIYATCSSEPEENEDVAAQFLRASPDFVAVDARRVHPALPPGVVDERGHLRTAPTPHELEAFFGAVFERARQL